MGPIALLAQTACVWEATARKPGNVHRFADFEDTTYVDYLLSAAAVAPVLDGAAGRRVGHSVLAAVEARRQVVRSNTNLGILSCWHHWPPSGPTSLSTSAWPASWPGWT
jgi:triphosphoribosyl-dephospho-CoA synthase